MSKKVMIAGDSHIARLKLYCDLPNDIKQKNSDYELVLYGNVGKAFKNLLSEKQDGKTGLEWIQSTNPDLLVVSLGTNLAAYTTVDDITKFCYKLHITLPNTKIAFTTPFYVLEPNTPNSAIDSVSKNIRIVANAQGCPIYDINKNYGSAFNNSEMMDSDKLHLTHKGCAKFGELLINFILKENVSGNNTGRVDTVTDCNDQTSNNSSNTSNDNTSISYNGTSSGDWNRKNSKKEAKCISKYDNSFNILSKMQIPGNKKVEELMHHAAEWVGTTWVWGGWTPKVAADCSSFLSMLYKEIGINSVTGNCYTQVNQGSEVGSNMSNWKPGDCIYVTHDGTWHALMYIGNNKIVHNGCSCGVIVVNWDGGGWMGRVIEIKGVRRHISWS